LPRESGEVVASAHRLITGSEAQDFLSQTYSDDTMYKKLKGLRVVSNLNWKAALSEDSWVSAPIGGLSTMRFSYPRGFSWGIL
jgi:hypothetical protein